MSLAAALRRTLNTRRSPAPVSRALLDIDAGAMMTPTTYPYPPGARPVRPFGGRVVLPGRGPRPSGQLYPPTGNPTQRAFAHVDRAGQAAGDRSATRDASGIRSQAKIVRTRPWLFAGGSSATAADRSAAPAPSSSSGPCEGC